MKQDFHSNGKLLLTGEYVVLDGALSLAIPTSYGQSLSVEEIDEPMLVWTSLDEKGIVWFENVLEIKKGKILNPLQNNDNYTKRLIQILNAAIQLKPDFINQLIGNKIITKLDFPRNWGLGSSSTLINNIANWVKVDAHNLLEKTFGGSGYDIAAAQNDQPILYSILNNKAVSKKVKLNWTFTNQLFFIYLNKKQNSREGIAQYRSQILNTPNIVNKISELTTKFIKCKTLLEFESLIQQHENLISNVIKLKPIKEVLFKNYPGAIKSLGAWGGDFILVTGEKSKMEYFKNKGFETIIPFNKMIK